MKRNDQDISESEPNRTEILARRTFRTCRGRVDKTRKCRKGGRVQDKPEFVRVRVVVENMDVLKRLNANDSRLRSHHEQL